MGQSDNFDIMQAFNSEYAQKIFWILCRMTEDNKLIKITLVKFPKIFLFSQMGNFGPIVVQNYTSLHTRISSEDSFQTLQDRRGQ